MAKRSRAELDGYSFPARDDDYGSRRLNARGESLALPSLVMICAVAMAWIVVVGIPVPASIKEMIGVPLPIEEKIPEAFRLAVNKAMRAAELTQTAQYQEEWQKVAVLWTESIELMERVPDTSAKHEIAQAKVIEYGRNLEYANSNVNSRPYGAPISNQLWAKGATREFLLAVQGLPTDVERHDNLCKETYYYNNSTVELHHGIVISYRNQDINLNAVPPEKLSAQDSLTRRNTRVWGLGATERDILAIQGTPTQVKRYESLEMDIFYYESSIIQLRNSIVVGYSNFNDTLRVDVNAMVPNLGHRAVPSVGLIESVGNSWGIGSSRADVFKVQGTPTQVTRGNVGCEETLHYENSTIELRNGIVEEYNNFGNNLKVRLANALPATETINDGL